MRGEIEGVWVLDFRADISFLSSSVWDFRRGLREKLRVRDLFISISQGF